MLFPMASEGQITDLMEGAFSFSLVHSGIYISALQQTELLMIPSKLVPPHEFHPGYFLN